MCFAILLKNFISVDVILCLSCSITAQVSHLDNKVRNVKVLHIFSVVSFWNSERGKCLLITFKACHRRCVCN